MNTSHTPLRAFSLGLLLLASPALASGCGCRDSSWDDHDQSNAAAAGAVAVGLGVVALTSPLWLDGGRPYVEGAASTVVGRGSFSPPDEQPLLANAVVMNGAGGSLSAGVSRLDPSPADSLGVRGEVAVWHNQFSLRDKAAQPAPQNFNATTLALGAHVDGRLRGVPVVASLGGRLGGAYLYSPNTDQGAFAWDAELVAGLGVELDSHWMLTSQIRAVALMPGSNDFTVGNGHAILADVGLRYNF